MHGSEPRGAACVRAGRRDFPGTLALARLALGTPSMTGSVSETEPSERDSEDRDSEDERFEGARQRPSAMSPKRVAILPMVSVAAHFRWRGSRHIIRDKIVGLIPLMQVCIYTAGGRKKAGEDEKAAENFFGGGGLHCIVTLSWVLRLLTLAPPTTIRSRLTNQEACPPSPPPTPPSIPRGPNQPSITACTSRRACTDRRTYVH